jgi:hypothetical protein
VEGFGADPGAHNAAGALFVLALATVASPLAQGEAESAEIAANRRASASFWELVPKMEAIGGDGFISHLRLRKRRNPALERDSVKSG